MSSDAGGAAFFSKQDLRHRWSVSVRTVERLMAEGALGEPVMIRQSPRYPLRAVETYERAQRVVTAPILAAPTVPRLRFFPVCVGAAPYFSVCVAHIKGGVGKTTTSIYLGRELSALKLRVIWRDLDPQKSLTTLRTAPEIRAKRTATTNQRRVMHIRHLLALIDEVDDALRQELALARARIDELLA